MRKPNDAADTEVLETPVETKAVQDATQETAVEETKVTQETPTQVAYVGPTILGVVVQNTVFNNGLTNELTAAIQEEPVLASLLVPITELGEALNKITNKQGALYVSYTKAAGYKKGE